MSHTIGVRQLKNQASRIVRTVREEKAEYVITLRGEPVAVLRAFTDDDARQLHQAHTDQVLAEMRALAVEIGDAWTSPMTGTELVEEQRR